MGPAPGMPPPQPPKSGGTNVALIIVIVLALLAATGVGGCLICMCVAKSATSSGTKTASGSPPSSPGGDTTPQSGNDWITSERPYVKFLAPPGWIKDIKGDWGVFTSPNRTAVFAFTTFTHPGESTVRLGKAAGVLGVGEVDWKSPTYTTLGRDNFPAHMGEGTCNFHGPGGYMWYATVDSGTSDQMLLIYTVAASGTKAEKDAVLTSIRSLQRR